MPNNLHQNTDQLVVVSTAECRTKMLPPSTEKTRWRRSYTKLSYECVCHWACCI